MIREELGKIRVGMTYKGLGEVLVQVEDFAHEDGAQRVVVVYRILATGTAHVCSRSSFVRRFLPVKVEQAPEKAFPLATEPGAD